MAAAAVGRQTLQTSVASAQGILEPATSGFAGSLSRLREEIEKGGPIAEAQRQSLIDFPGTTDPLIGSLLEAAQLPGDTRAAEQLRELNLQPGIEAPTFDIQATFSDPNFQALDERERRELEARFASIGKSLSGEAFETDTARRSRLATGFAQDKFTRDLQSAQFARGERTAQIDALATESGISLDNERQAFNKLISGVNAQQIDTEADFNRLVQTISTEANITADRLNQILTEVNIGQQAAFRLVGLEAGLGTQLADIELQKGNVQAAARAAEGAGGRFLLDTALKIGGLIVSFIAAKGSSNGEA